jgi:phosphoglycolate phosphatase
MRCMTTDALWPGRAIRALAFDLDGTLIDTAPDIGAALDAALRSQGLPGVPPPAVRPWIGDGPDRLIERALDHLRVDATPALRRALREGFDEATLEAPMRHGRVFDGVAELLDRLRATHRTIVAVTNKPTPLSRRVLDAAGLLRHLDAVHGADVPEQRKPAPALLLAAAQRLNVAPASLLMVGDSVNDLRCARAAGCPAAWVAWGYGAWPEDAAPDTWRVSAPQELLARLDSGNR